jgi:hypothetical protein
MSKRKQRAVLVHEDNTRPDNGTFLGEPTELWLALGFLFVILRIFGVL